MVGVFVIVAVVIVAIGMLVAGPLRHRRAVREIASTLGGTAAGSVATFTADGREYRCECFAGGRYERQWVALRTDSATQAPWVVVPAGGAGRFGAAFGRGERCRTGDAAFDESFRLHSTSAVHVTTFFAVAERRDAIRALFALGAAEVAQDDVEVGVRWAKRAADHDVGATLVPAAVPALRRLAEGSPSADARARARRFVVMGRAIWAAFLVLALAGGLLAGVAEDSFQVLDWNGILLASLQYSVPLALGVAILVWRSGMLRSASQRTRALALLGLPVVLPFFVLQVAIVANGALDGGPATPHDTSVIALERSGGRHPDYAAVVASWRGRAHEHVYVTRTLFRRLAPDARLHVVTKPGRFGYEWIESYELIDAGQ